MPYLFIVLFSRSMGADVAGSYHWALHASSSPDCPEGKIQLYQIQNNTPEDRETIVPWFKDHCIANPIDMVQYHSYVRLPALLGGFDTCEIEEIFRSFPSGQSDAVTFGGIRWCCSRWVINIIDWLVENEILQIGDLQEGDKFYQRVLAMGMRGERMHNGAVVDLLD